MDDNISGQPLAKRGIPNGIPMLQSKRPKLGAGVSGGRVVPNANPSTTTPQSKSRSVFNSPQTNNKYRYVVLIRKQTTKKNKPWQMDGKLIVPVNASDAAILRSDDGTLLARQNIDRTKIKPDAEFQMGEYEICINDEDLENGLSWPSSTPAKMKPVQTLEDLKRSQPSGPPQSPVKPPLNPSTAKPDSESIELLSDDDNDDVMVLDEAPATPKSQPNSQPSSSQCSNSQSKAFEAVYRKPSTKSLTPYTDDGTVLFSSGRATLKNTKGKVLGSVSVNKISPGDKLTIGGKQVMVCDDLARVEHENKNNKAKPAPVLTPVMSTRKTDKPRYEINDESIIMPRVKADLCVDVVVDPFLGRKLRPHQIDGVKFLYECIMGMRNTGGRGALLADEMGLGKTLMTITLIWTLLNQSPFQGERPVLKRVLIACPVTLLQNWKAEFCRWLETRVKVFVMDDKADLGIFKYSRCSVMLIGYDRLRILNDSLAALKFDLIVCDEAQKLKKVDTRSTQAIVNLGIEKKIMLSGTPIQNNLSEFYAMVQVLNPGVLGTAPEFKRQFEDPIMRGRDATSTHKLKRVAEEKLRELTDRTGPFVLRRTNELIAQSLPPRTDTVLFCAPSAEQVAAYRVLCDSSEVWREVDELEEAELDLDKRGDLSTMLQLKKISNSPLLMQEGYHVGGALRPTAFDSGKMQVLKQLLVELHTKTDEKVVVVSQYTKTLDLIEQMLGQLNMSSRRLDGATATHARQTLVDEFNRSNQKAAFVFMTSTRSGGAGINLVGASRLVLFDCDWNPSWDSQAMARIHRMGQKRPVYTYRLLTTGCIDECIFQRQITKQSLADQFMDADGAAATASSSTTSDRNSFTKEELRDIFTLHTNTVSHTHDLLGCKCLDPPDAQSQSQSTLHDTSEDEDEMGGFTTAASVASDGIFVPKQLRPETKMKGLLEYQHHSPANGLSALGDNVLRRVSLNNAPVSFIMTKRNR